MAHQDLVDKALSAIKEVFNDNQVSKEQTEESLESIKDEIDIYLDTL